MRFSLKAAAIIGAATLVQAAPAVLPDYEQEGQPVVYQSEGQAVTIQPFTTRVVLTSIGAGPTGLPLPFDPAEGIAGGAGEFGPVNNDNNPQFSEPIGVNITSEQQADNVGDAIFGDNPNQNELGGVAGNAGSDLGTGTNAFNTTLYNYNGLDQQSGQSSSGAYGPNSGGDRGFESSQATAPGQSFPPSQFTIFFKLVANATEDDFLGINGFNLGTYHVNAGSSIASLTSPSGGTDGSNAGTGRGTGNRGNGRVFYTNGTVEEVLQGRATTVTSGGTDVSKSVSSKVCIC